MDPTGPHAAASPIAALAQVDKGSPPTVHHDPATTNNSRSSVVVKASTASVDTSLPAMADANMPVVATAVDSLSGGMSEQHQHSSSSSNNNSSSNSAPTTSSVSSTPPFAPSPAGALSPTAVASAADASVPSFLMTPAPAPGPTCGTPDLLQPTPTTTVTTATPPPLIERTHSPRLPSRPVRLIRNLHANYFSASKRPDSPLDAEHASYGKKGSSFSLRRTFAASDHTSAIGRAIASLQRTVYAFGASTSLVGCYALFFQSCQDHGAGPKLWIQLAYYGLFAAACSWQCIAPAFRSSEEPPASLPPRVTPPWAIGYSVLSLLSSPLITPFSSLLSLSSPLVALSHWAPVVMTPLLYGLGIMTAAAENDQTQYQQEVYRLKERHEQALESCRNDNLLRKNMLLETVGKEVQDAAALAIESLRHMTPTSLFPPSIPREQLTPCTIPVPITSVLGLFTTLRHLQYISRNMQRLSRVLFTEYVQGIVEKTSPHYHRGDTGFDVGEFVQSIGDLISADASLKGIEFVIYHTEYELNHVQIKGSEDSWRHALINLIKSIMDWGKPGSTVELCLNLSALSQPGQTRNKVLVSFEITYVPNPAMAGNVDDLSELNALLASKLVKAMGGSLEIEETESRGRRFIVAVEVEVNTSANHAHRAGTNTPTPADNQNRPLEHPAISALSPSHLLAQDHSPVPSQPGSPKPSHITLGDLTLPPPRDYHTRASPSLDQRLEQLQTAHQEHPSRQYYEQHLAQQSRLRTPMVSPSGIPPSPSPRKGASFLKVSQEPTVQDLLKFSRKLTGVKIVLWAKESSAFAMRLSGYLRAWGINLIQMDIPESSHANGKPGGWTDSQSDHSGNIVFSPVPKRSASSSSLSNQDGGSYGAKQQQGKGGNEAGESGSMGTNANVSAFPAFVLIDDDVNVLSQQIVRLQAAPQSPSLGNSNGNSNGNGKRHSHKRSKSISSIQQTHIIYFTSLPTFKQARETILSVLSSQNIGYHYNIMSTPPTPGSNVPFILVLPKPAGPRRILTAIHTAIHTPVLDQNFSPIATAPTPPAPPVRPLSEEANPMETADVWFDPVTKQAFAARPSTASQGGSPGQNHSQSTQNMRQANIQRLIDAGASQASANKASENRSAGSPSLSTSSAGSVAGSPKGMPTVPAPVATPTFVGNGSGSVLPPPTRVVSSTTPQIQNYKRRSASIARISGQIIPSSNSNGGSSTTNGEGGIVVIPSAGSGQFNGHQPFSAMGAPQSTAHRNSISSDGYPTPTESSGRRTPSFPFATFSSVGSGGSNNNSPSHTPLGVVQSPSGEYIISPPMARHAGMGSTGSSSSIPGRTSVSSEATSPFVSPGLERALSTTPIMESPMAVAHLESAATAAVAATGSAAASASSATTAVAARSPGSPAPRVNPTSPMSIVQSRAGGGSIDASKPRAQLQSTSVAAKKNGVVERVSPLINVLIVEDNFINQRVLVKFMQQKHIKYDVASNGKEAVDKWKVGGFHLILMDIQMPVMDGIEATRQIREMERLQRIGVTGSTYSSSPDPEKMSNGHGDLGPSPEAATSSTATTTTTTDNNGTGSNDSLAPSTPASSSTATSVATNATTTATPASFSSSPFKSPVIIVALTAAAKNDSTRDLALAAGCNDFITKPVTNVWLERKIVDWGCMQALIDIEGWKKWKQELEATNGSNYRGSGGGSSALSPLSSVGSGGGNGGSGGGERSAGGSSMSGSATSADGSVKSLTTSPSRLSAKRPSVTLRTIKGLKPPLKKDKTKELSIKEVKEPKEVRDGKGAAEMSVSVPASAAKDAKAAEKSVAGSAVPVPETAPAAGTAAASAAADAAATPAPRQADSSAPTASSLAAPLDQ